MSKFKRGGVNWAYQIFAEEANLQCNRGEKNRLILFETDCFYKWTAQTKLDQHNLDQPVEITETNLLTFTAYNVPICSTRLINFT